MHLETLHQLWKHLFWADALIFEALADAAGSVPGALREEAHILGAEEIWLARLEGRASRAAVWPELPLAEVRELAERTHEAYQVYLAGLAEEDLSTTVTYANSAGDRFTNSVGDILLHVALHGQYHRGKVNLLLRQAGHAPAPADYIAFVRGAPAATEATSRRR